MDQRAKDLIGHGDSLFSDSQSRFSLLQEIADNFYPERADFTVTRSMGMDFASILTTSYPVLARRELTNTVSMMLRPYDKEWFDMSTLREDRLDQDAKKWLQAATAVQRRAMYDRESRFHVAAPESDADLVIFGQSVKSCELNRDRTALLYRSWHLRDVVWAVNYMGEIDTIHRKAKVTYREFCKEFPKYVSGQTPNASSRSDLAAKFKDKMEKCPYDKIEYRHIIIPADEYDYKPEKYKGMRLRHPFISIYIDCENQEIISEEGIWNKRYIIPRWQTVSGGWQYSYSPATVAAMPDARLIQAFTLILLEAGEKAVSPPMVTPGGMIRGDVNLFPAGITAYDAEYDERTGEVLRMIPHDYSGIQFSREMFQDIRSMLDTAFYRNVIALPQITKEMTAFEVGQRVSQYVRSAMPVFGPLEPEENGQTCEMTFDLLLREGAFGSIHDMPQSLRGQDINFKFTSPLHAQIEAQKVQLFAQAKGMISESAGLDQGVVSMLDVRTALRDALEGNATPQAWLRNNDQMDKINDTNAKNAQLQQTLDLMNKGAMTAKNIGDANTALSGMPPRTTAQAMPG